MEEIAGLSVAMILAGSRFSWPGTVMVMVAGLLMKLKELEMMVAQAGWLVKWEGQVKYGVSGSKSRVSSRFRHLLLALTVSL